MNTSLRRRNFMKTAMLAAGAIPPRIAFTHAFNAGADFVLAGMFDWQIAENAGIAREVLAGVKRSRSSPETGAVK